ncbi:kinase-like domain-containing protein [Geranomyces variabilis]|nr:kinase-like domain-containing protein [Geranomyces variabilis]KAJ3136272.1 Cell division control protein 2 [Geranomyces variabilis]
MSNNEQCRSHLHAVRRHAAKAALASAADPANASASSSSSAVTRSGPDNYSAFEYIFRGAFGKVFKALGPAGEPVAIKIVDIFQANMPDSVPEIGLFQLIAMEYCPSDLDRLIRENYLTFEEVTWYMSQICDGVAYVHGHQVVHRDLKPANILLTAEDVVKIADFGAARQICSQRVMERGVGTTWYCAPELIDLKYKGSYTFTSTLADMWSVGCILAEMMSNRPLLNAERPEEVLTQMASLDNDGSIETWLAQETETCVLRASIPWSLTQWDYACTCLLERLVAFDPEERLSARDARDVFLKPIDAGVTADEPLAG